jgi:hypothetical protein
MTAIARLAQGAFIAIALIALAIDVSAAELKTPQRSCTAADCGATVLFGRLNKSDRCCGFANLAMPWVVQLYANKSECLRLHITAKVGNVELVAIAPGTQRAWRNGAAAGPLLKIRSNANEEGWFLVEVNESAGIAGNSEFTLKYARYVAGNVNCNSPTSPLAAP